MIFNIINFAVYVSIFDNVIKEYLYNIIYEYLQYI